MELFLPKLLILESENYSQSSFYRPQ